MDRTLSRISPLDRPAREVSSGGYTVTIGLIDCDYIAVTGEDVRLEHAREEQHRWTARAHANYWTNLLPQLVKGRRSTADATSLAAALLEQESIPVEELHLAPGTIRRQVSPAPTRPSGRPSLERGRDLLEKQGRVSQGVALRRFIGTDWNPDLALPRVWRDGEDTELTVDSYFNPMIPEWARPGVESDVLARAEELLASAAGYPRCSLRRAR